MAGHAEKWVYGELLNTTSMESTQLGKEVIEILRDSGILPVLAFPCSAFYLELVESFYLHLKGDKNCLSLNGEILGVKICFAPHTIINTFHGLCNEGEASISVKSYKDGWMVMRGTETQPNAYDNKKSLYEPIDDVIADITDKYLLLRSGCHDKITKAQQELMGAIRLKENIRWSEILFTLLWNNVIDVRTNTPLAGRKSLPVMIYHVLINHFLCHYTTIANDLNNFTATPVELAKVFDVIDIQRAINVAIKRGEFTIPAVPRTQKRKAEVTTDALAEEDQPKPKAQKPKPRNFSRPSSP